jgi:hypothetical protein
MGPPMRPSRTAVSYALIIVAAVVLLVGGIAWYAREEIVDPNGFADHAVEALQNDEVRDVAANEFVVNVIDRGSTDLVSARPILESVVATVVRTKPFERLFRSAAISANRLMFTREKESVAFDIADATKLVKPALKSVAPGVAREVPDDLDAQLLRLKDSSFHTQAVRVADDVDELGTILPIIGVLLLAGGIAAAPDRRRGITAAGIAVAAACATAVGLLAIGEAQLLANVNGTETTDDGDARQAAEGIYDAYLNDLRMWSYAIGAGALLLAAAAAASVDPAAATARARARLEPILRPASPAARAARAGLAVLVGVWIILRPGVALEMAALLVAAFLVFFGTTELIALVSGPRRMRRSEARATRRRTSRRPLLVAGGAAAAGILAVVLTLSLTGDERKRRRQAAVTACNGSPALCDRPINEVVFPGTHNSMSAADQNGWYFANQRRGITRQLRDGIRLLLIDPHLGVRDRRGRVRTDLLAEGADRNRVAKQLSPDAIPAAERLVGRIGFGQLRGKRDTFLCHTLCELGATHMVGGLREVRDFLRRNRGEVVVILVEPFVSPERVEEAFRKSGLLRYTAELERDEPMPTLRELIRDDKRVVVFTERGGGAYPWYHDQFSFTQDTPLGVEHPGDFSCNFARGDENSPIFMLNRWVDRFPPPLTDNRRASQREALLGYARRCQRRRGLLPGLIAVDFYDQGNIVDVARELNRLPPRR